MAILKWKTVTNFPRARYSASEINENDTVWLQKLASMQQVYEVHVHKLNENWLQ